MISDIDPMKPDNIVSAGIVNTTLVIVGCLVRLEPDKQTKVSVCVCVCVCGYSLAFSSRFDSYFLIFVQLA